MRMTRFSYKILSLALLASAFSGVSTQRWPDWENDEMYYGTFPDDFIWASASSAYQVEGAWDKDGKSMSIWDTYVREPGRIADNSTGDVACDSYHKYMEDIKILKDLGVGSYRFSFAWARIFPNEDDISPNENGIRYYNNLIDAMIAEGIQPLGTIYHWDLPQWIEDKGGWLNESLVVEEFSIYSRALFENFGDRVKDWITINEPWVVAWLGYGPGIKAPGKSDKPGEDPYIVGHSCLLAHAEAWHIYNDEFRATQGGQIGISFNTAYGWPLDPDNPLDVEAANRMMSFDLGWFADPIYKGGAYPPEMVDRIRNKSLAQGFPQSRLPEFTPEEAARVSGTSDFFGLNFYHGFLIEHREFPLNPPNYSSDKDYTEQPDPSWPQSGSSWLRVVPASMRGILNWIKNRYDNPPVFITENGVSDRNQSLHDEHRITYLRGYINNMLKAVDLDGCNVVGYTAWCLMDNYEWEFGYLEYFGIHYTNFSSPDRERIAKDSANYFKQVIIDNGFPAPVTDPPPTIPDNSASGLYISWLMMILFVAFM